VEKLEWFEMQDKKNIMERKNMQKKRKKTYISSDIYG